MNKKIILSVVVLLIFSYINAFSEADINTVKTLKASVEKRLKDVKVYASQYASVEIGKIERHLSNTNKYITDGKIEKAFYEITIGNAYFTLIDAKKQLFNANKNSEEVKKLLK